MLLSFIFYSFLRLLTPLLLDTGWCERNPIAMPDSRLQDRILYPGCQFGANFAQVRFTIAETDVPEGSVVQHRHFSSPVESLTHRVT